MRRRRLARWRAAPNTPMCISCYAQAKEAAKPKAYARVCPDVAHRPHTLTCTPHVSVCGMDPTHSTKHRCSHDTAHTRHPHAYAPVLSSSQALPSQRASSPLSRTAGRNGSSPSTTRHKHVARGLLPLLLQLVHLVHHLRRCRLSRTSPCPWSPASAAPPSTAAPCPCRRPASCRGGAEGRA